MTFVLGVFDDRFISELPEVYVSAALVGPGSHQVRRCPGSKVLQDKGQCRSVDTAVTAVYCSNS